MLNISLMQCYFFKYLLEFLYNLAGFQSNIKKVQEKIPAKLLMFLRAKPLLNFIHYFKLGLKIFQLTLVSDSSLFIIRSE